MRPCLGGGTGAARWAYQDGEGTLGSVIMLTGMHTFGCNHGLVHGICTVGFGGHTAERAPLQPCLPL